MRGTNAWTFKDVVTFLEQNHFRHVHTEGSHYFYEGYIEGEFVITEVQFHSSAYIKKSTLEKSIIAKSRIPAEEWKKYTRLPPNKRKKYSYSKASVVPKK